MNLKWIYNSNLSDSSPGSDLSKNLPPSKNDTLITLVKTSPGKLSHKIGHYKHYILT